MTWKQLKEIVDRKMEEQGIRPDLHIGFIDLVSPNEKSIVVLDGRHGLIISNREA